jgi:uncharacterized protein
MRAIVFVLSLALFTGCASNFTNNHQYFTAYEFGELTQAENSLSNIVSKKVPNNNFQQSKDAVCLLLDRATMRFTMNNIVGAAKDYLLAIEAMDFYTQDCTAEMFTQVLLDDECCAYSGEDYEQILARVYFALVLLHQGDYGNAYAILRQAEELQQRKKELYAHNKITENYELIDNSVAKYLLAAILENRGDFSNAYILYNQVKSILNADHIPFECQDNPSKKRENATVLVLCHNGNSPRKVSGTCNASVASSIALELLLSTQNIPPAVSSMTGIPIPLLMQRAMSEPRPTYVTIDGCEQYLAPFFDVSSTAYKQLHQKMPLIVARGVARFALRRSAVAYAQNQDPCLGSIVDIAMLVANANTQADTRSWLTLPNTIDLTRFDISSGNHELTVHVDVAMQPPFKGVYNLILLPGDLCIINVFNFSPGISSVQIPQRFINN